MTDKAIKSIQKAEIMFNAELSKDIDTLDIQPDVLLQEFYVFIGHTKYVLRVHKEEHKYIYNISLRIQSEILYRARMSFDIYTGRVKIPNVYLNNIARH